MIVCALCSSISKKHEHGKIIKKCQIGKFDYPPELFLGKGVLKICSKFTGEHPYRSVISIKLQSNFIEITLRHGCSLVALLHNFRAPI